MDTKMNLLLAEAADATAAGAGTASALSMVLMHQAHPESLSSSYCKNKDYAARKAAFQASPLLLKGCKAYIRTRA